MKPTSFLKPFISLYVSLIKSNKNLQKYIFSIPLKKEVADYVENGYFQGYAHIEKSIELAQKIQLEKMGIIDVGGAIGNTAKLFAEQLPQSNVWVFEPIKETYQKLINATSAFSNIKAINKAVGNTAGKTLINVANRITSSSILNIKSETSSAVFSDTLVKNGEEEIEITTLDGIIPPEAKISILKIDAQGYELEVLKGGTKTLTRTGIITLELNNHEHYQNAPKYYELDEYLRNSGFIVYDIFPSLKDNGRLKEWDAIYVKKELVQ